MALEPRHAEGDAGGIGSECLAKGAHKDDYENDEEHLWLEEHTDIDEHAHTDKEIGNEEGIADKLYAPHEGRHGGDETIEDKSAEEGAEHTLKTYKFAQGGTHKHHGEYEDVLHDGVAIVAKEGTSKTRDGIEH